MSYSSPIPLKVGVNTLWFHGAPDSIEFVAPVGASCTFAYAGVPMCVLTVDAGKTSEVFQDGTDWRAGWYSITSTAIGTLTWTYKE